MRTYHDKAFVTFCAHVNDQSNSVHDVIGNSQESTVYAILLYQKNVRFAESLAADGVTRAQVPEVLKNLVINHLEQSYTEQLSRARPSPDREVRTLEEVVRQIWVSP